MESKETGKIGVYDGKDFITDPQKNVSWNIKKYFNKNFLGKEISNIKYDQARKYAYPGKKQAYFKDVKAPSITILDDIINSNYKVEHEEAKTVNKDGSIKKHTNLDMSGGINRYSVKIGIPTNDLVNVYDADILTRIDKNGKEYFYDLDRIKEATVRAVEKSKLSVAPFMTKSIPQNSKNVNDNNVQHSISVEEEQNKSNDKYMWHSSTKDSIDKIKQYGFRYDKDSSYFATNYNTSKNYGEDMIMLAQGRFNIKDVTQELEGNDNRELARNNAIKEGYDGIKYKTSKNNYDIEITNTQKLNEVVKETEKENERLVKELMGETTKYSISENANEEIQGMKVTKSEVEDTVYDKFEQTIEENGFDVDDIQGVYLHGSRLRGNANTNSDLDAVVFYIGNEREDNIFNTINDSANQLEIDGVKVDINPVSIDSLSEIDEYIKNSEQYDKEVLNKKNKEYSISDKDSTGKKLTKQQQEYFKDTKVVDEDGNLLEVYRDGDTEINVFDRNKAGKRGSWYGTGFYFTSDPNEASFYGDVNNYYVDIKNPYLPTQDNIKENGEVDFAESFYKDFENRFKDQLPNNWESEKNKGNVVRNILEKNGYDGVINGTNYVAFNSNQIKNTDNTNPTTNEDVRYSISDKDSNGRTLTKEQREYFKDSKVVDDNGNLLTVYHGTPFGTFYTFKGNNFFFSEDYNFAEDYADSKSIEQGIDGERKVLEVYLNATNLFDINNQEHINKLKENLPDTMSFWGNTFDKDTVIDRIQRRKTLGPKWTKEQIKGKQFGDYIGNDRDGYNTDMFVGLNNNNEIVYMDQIRGLNNFTKEEKNKMQQKLINGEEVTISVYKTPFGEMSENGIKNKIVSLEQEAQKYKSETGYNNESIESTIKILKNKLDTIKKGYDFDSYTYKIKPKIATLENTQLTDIDNWEYFETLYDKNSDKDLIDIIKDLGFDGINMYEEGKSNYVVFSPNQIKSVDNKKPTSDPDIRYSISDNGEMQDNNGNKVTLETTDTGTTGTLMAMHNLSEDKLKGILELNGIPVPSIAITDPSKVSFSQFGDGTLLFNKSTIDPAVNKNRVYDRDVWSPTFPVVDNEIISKNIDSVAKEIGIRDYYLEDYAERSHNAEDLFYQVANDEDVVKQYLDKNKIKYDDEMSLRQMRELAEQNGFEEYLKPKLETLYGEKGIYNGKERYTPSGKLRTFWQTHDKYNLANIVKIMTSGGTVDNSSNMFSGGFGSIQANMNHKFTSIQDIKNAESRISPTADTDIETLQDNLSNSISALTEYGNDASGNPFTAFSRTSEVVTEFASKEKQTVETLKETLKDFYWSRADEVPKKVLKSVVDNVNALKNIPTDYFEAKPQRAVGLDEIQAAVISNKWSPEIKQELKNRGIEYIEYDPKVEGARDKAINQYENLKFSISDNNNIAPINKDMVVQDNKQPIAPIRDTNVNTQTENKIAPIREDTKPTTNDPTKETSYDKPVKKITRKTKIQL